MFSLKQKTNRRVFLGALAAVGLGVSVLGASAGAANIDKIHFLIPGGAGGGWDGTARGTGEALTKSGIIA